jgi:hemolysin III
VSFAIYGFSLVLLFTSSTLHHSVMTSTKAITFLRVMDYNSIFLLIAGTYTPICLIAVRSSYGWTILSVCWAAALFGIAMKSTRPNIPKWFTQTLYVSMGWLGAAIAFPLYSALGAKAAGLLVAGGIFYTVGSVIFIIEKPNPVPGKFGFHEIWHLFVLAGAGLHAAMMFILLDYAG